MDFATVVTALGGASIGALSSIATLWIQSNYQTRQEMKKLAIEFAREDYSARLQEPGQPQYAPAASLIYYYVELISLADRGQLNEDIVRSLIRKQVSLAQAAYDEADKLAKMTRP